MTLKSRYLLDIILHDKLYQNFNLIENNRFNKLINIITKLQILNSCIHISNLHTQTYNTVVGHYHYTILGPKLKLQSLRLTPFHQHGAWL
jgi:hypothetical protein